MGKKKKKKSGSPTLLATPLETAAAKIMLSVQEMAVNMLQKKYNRKLLARDLIITDIVHLGLAIDLRSLIMNASPSTIAESENEIRVIVHKHAADQAGQAVLYAVEHECRRVFHEALTHIQDERKNPHFLTLLLPLILPQTRTADEKDTKVDDDPRDVRLLVVEIAASKMKMTKRMDDEMQWVSTQKELQLPIPVVLRAPPTVEGLGLGQLHHHHHHHHPLPFHAGHPQVTPSASAQGSLVKAVEVEKKE
jgi:hypothetical protein